MNREGGWVPNLLCGQAAAGGVVVPRGGAKVGEGWCALMVPPNDSVPSRFSRWGLHARPGSLGGGYAHARVSVLCLFRLVL